MDGILVESTLYDQTCQLNTFEFDNPLDYASTKYSTRK